MSPASGPRDGSAPNSPTRPRHGHPGHVRLSGSRGPNGGVWVPKGGNVGRRLSVAMLAVGVALLRGSFSLTGAGAQSSPDPAQVGRFLPPFEDTRPGEGAEACRTDADGRQLCKPAGATVVALNNGKVLYWDALEGTENIELSIVLEFAKQARNDRSR